MIQLKIILFSIELSRCAIPLERNSRRFIRIRVSYCFCFVCIDACNTCDVDVVIDSFHFVLLSSFRTREDKLIFLGQRTFLNPIANLYIDIFFSFYRLPKNTFPAHPSPSAFLSVEVTNPYDLMGLHSDSREIPWNNSGNKETSVCFLFFLFLVPYVFALDFSVEMVSSSGLRIFLFSSLFCVALFCAPADAIRALWVSDIHYNSRYHSSAPITQGCMANTSSRLFFSSSCSSSCSSLSLSFSSMYRLSKEAM